MSFRRMLPFILINIVVSAVVVLAILFWWDNRQTETGIAVSETAVSPSSPAISTAAAVAESLPQPTDTPAPDPNEPLIHTVQAGDTLMSISQFYDVSMDDIIVINNITNPNILSVGQQIIIPIGGLPTATPAPTATTAVAVIPSPNPTAELEQGEISLSITSVVGVGELASEAVQIVNTGSQVGLLNWKVADTNGHVYTFDRFTLFGDGAGVLLHTETGEDSATDLYWGLEEPIWQSGEQVTLIDAENTIQATFIVP